MRIRRHKIKKNPNTIALHEFSAAVINKNTKVEKEHIITKIKKRQSFYTLCLSSFFVLIILLILLIIGTSFKKYIKINTYDSGTLSVEYDTNDNGIGDIISLTDSDIIDDLKIKDDKTYGFTITNESKSLVKYKINILKDNDIIRLDNCKDKLFPDELIKYNINGGKIFTLNGKFSSNRYTLIEDVIPGNSSKIYYINVWVDKDAEYMDRHFHGIIDVNME